MKSKQELASASIDRLRKKKRLTILLSPKRCRPSGQQSEFGRVDHYRKVNILIFDDLPPDGRLIQLAADRWVVRSPRAIRVSVRLNQLRCGVYFRIHVI